MPARGPQHRQPEPTTASDPPRRAVLHGVRRVGYGILERGRDAEICPFPSCLSACLEFMGEDLGSHENVVNGEVWRENDTYIYIMGTSGSAFRLSWKPGWHLDNDSIIYMSDEPDEPFRRAFASVGFTYETVTVAEARDNEAHFRARIIESIHQRCRPVLYFGVVGPPECCIITGYDDGGDVLIGWSYFQSIPPFNADVEFEPSGEFRKRRWFQGTFDSLFLIGEKRARPSSTEIHRSALEWALRVVTTPTTWGDRQNGLAAYTAWADAMSRDDEFALDDADVLRHRLLVYNDASGTVAEGRWYAAQFLDRVAACEPGMAPDLEAAAANYRKEHDLMRAAWDLTGGVGFSDEHALQLAQPDVRRQIVQLILAAREEDARAVRAIERALAS